MNLAPRLPEVAPAVVSVPSRPACWRCPCRETGELVSWWCTWTLAVDPSQLLWASHPWHWGRTRLGIWLCGIPRPLRPTGKERAGNPWILGLEDWILAGFVVFIYNLYFWEVSLGERLLVRWSFVSGKRGAQRVLGQRLPAWQAQSEKSFFWYWIFLKVSCFQSPFSYCSLLNGACVLIKVTFW